MSSPRSVLPLRPVFEGAGEPRMFSVPTPRKKLGIFPSPRAFIEGENLDFFQVPKPRGKLEIFVSSRVYMEETVRTVTLRTSLCRFFANRLYLKEEEARNFPNSQSLKEERSKFFAFKQCCFYLFFMEVTIFQNEISPFFF